ncbi:ATP-grasp domain-containing protein [Photobacterium lutimaris]|uniref:ATP-grasp domain-containing protein n=1 Tax=Photobacterium lutimaris TaxID=388278 RepID=A0A2T3IY83_9GAMM|nr:ATP-grasp domain-containing protein [Photobacterium lutimaris]PSU33522.1 hypothetical protein C9I99_12130 [Photobacterium lutimaris]TDR74645.1 L-amino acid ligase [Photobacterium lutimaris]
MKNINSKRPWIIVDGYSSGSLYVDLLNKIGVVTYHVQSSRIIPDFYLKTFDKSKYEENFIYESDLNTLLDELKVLEPAVIIAGCEPGVKLADQLSEHLGTPSNGTKYSQARRDKYEMVQSLVKHGVKAAQTYRVSSYQALADAIEVIGFPVVIKPTASAGSDGVYICMSENEAQKAFDDVYLKEDRLGKTNDDVIVQELLNGKQYIVNTVSYDGKHYAVEIWIDHRIDTGSEYIYDHEKLIHNITELEQSIVNYTFDVLDALNINYGPCHVELMVNDGIPTLIEVGSRPAGGINHETMFKAQGFSHVSAAIDCYLNPKEPSFTKYKVNQKEVLAVALISNSEGYLKQLNGVSKIHALPSFDYLTGLPALGSYVPVTKDIFSQPGLLMLSHESEEQITKDLKTFRELEKDLFIMD